MTTEEKIERQIAEFIPGKLYFEAVKPGERLPFSGFIDLYFTTDDTFVYTPLKDDNGPLNLSMIFKYCTLLRERLQDPANKEKKLHHVTNGTDSKRTNAALLIGSFMVIVMEQAPQTVIAAFANISYPFTNFFDCWKSANIPGISLLDCLTGIYKATHHSFFNFKTFDVQEYDLRQEVQQGDMNWVIPNRLLAFKGPRTQPKTQPSFAPDFYLPHLQKMGIKTVVRLNKGHYDKMIFVNAGLKHHELYFGDGTIPTHAIVDEFLKIVEAETGGIAVHCKGGVGRTGTLICCSLIKHHNFSANEAIAWVRICRPGSVMGAQHNFLLEYAEKHKPNSPLTPPDTTTHVSSESSETNQVLEHEASVTVVETISVEKISAGSAPSTESSQITLETIQTVISVGNETVATSTDFKATAVIHVTPEN